jgi:DNA-binding beta-propeller fold protein YncE
VKNFLGYRIYRQIGSDPAFQLVYLTPPDSAMFIDKRLSLGQKVQYQISVLGLDFESERSDTVSIIPGPTTIWATDVYNRRIMKISHDGAHEIFQVPVDGYPWEVVVDREKENIWYVDILLNRVYFISGDDYKIVVLLPNSEPIDIALDVQNDRVWVADEAQGKIFAFSRSGDQLYEIDGFLKPSRLDCYFKDGSCWITDFKARTVTKLSKKGTFRIQIKNLILPQAVSINQNSGECWVADSSRVLKFDADGNLLTTIEGEVNAPIALAVDSVNGNCWVSDLNYFGPRSRLICFDSNGGKLFELPELNWPLNLAANSLDHSCIVAESGAGRILKISEDGTIFGLIEGYAYPRGLYLESMR